MISADYWAGDTYMSKIIYQIKLSTTKVCILFSNNGDIILLYLHSDEKTMPIMYAHVCALNWGHHEGYSGRRTLNCKKSIFNFCLVGRSLHVNLYIFILDNTNLNMSRFVFICRIWNSWYCRLLLCNSTFVTGFILNDTNYRSSRYLFHCTVSCLHLNVVVTVKTHCIPALKLSSFRL